MRSARTRTASSGSTPPPPVAAWTGWTGGPRSCTTPIPTSAELFALCGQLIVAVQFANHGAERLAALGFGVRET